VFVAVARIPSEPSALARAAAIAGLAAPDAARLLAGTLPRILVRKAVNPDRMVAELEKAGFAAFAAEPVADGRRLTARQLELGPEALVATDALGRTERCPWADVRAILRGVRILETTELTRTTERKVAPVKAIITGGLSITKKVETTTERTTATKEGFLLVQHSDGPGILLPERKLDYRCLGAGLQPSTHGNLMALLERLKAAAPHAPVDDRILRPGFLTGLPPLGQDPAELAILLVTRARELGC
jgi:hypothetical protein